MKALQVRQFVTNLEDVVIRKEAATLSAIFSRKLRAFLSVGLKEEGIFGL